MQIRIPVGVVSEDEFITIKTKLRMLCGVPADLIPDTHAALCSALRMEIKLPALQLWLLTRGYGVNVVWNTDPTKGIIGEGLEIVITPDDSDANRELLVLLAKAVDTQIKTSIANAAVINALNKGTSKWTS